MEQESLIPGFSEPVRLNQEEQEAEVKPPQKSNKTGVILVIIVFLAVLGIIYFRPKQAPPVQEEAKQPVSNLETIDANNKTVKELKESDNAEILTAGEKKGVYQVYFSKSGETDCSRVYPLERELKEGEEPISTALINLFFGPTEVEKEAGYSSFFSKETDYILHSVKVRKGAAYVDIKDIRNIMPNASSSCGSAQLLAQIRETLQQFPEINDFRVAIDSDPAPFYEWLQIGCQDNLCDKTPFAN